MRRDIELFGAEGQQSLLGVSSTHAQPMWTLKMEGAPFGAVHAGEWEFLFEFPLRNCELAGLLLG